MLEPCPFCGKTAMLASRELAGHTPSMALTRVWVCQCMDADCAGYYGGTGRQNGYVHQYQAIDAWNRRTPAAPAVERVRALEGVAEAARRYCSRSPLYNGEPVAQPIKASFRVLLDAIRQLDALPGKVER